MNAYSSEGPGMRRKYRKETKYVHRKGKVKSNEGRVPQRKKEVEKTVPKGRKGDESQHRVLFVEFVVLEIQLLESNGLNSASRLASAESMTTMIRNFMVTVEEQNA